MGGWADALIRAVGDLLPASDEEGTRPYSETATLILPRFLSLSAGDWTSTLFRKVPAITSSACVVKPLRETWNLGEFVTTFLRIFLDLLLFSRFSVAFYVSLGLLIGSLVAAGTNTPAIYWAAFGILVAIAIFVRIRLTRRKRALHYRP